MSSARSPTHPTSVSGTGLQVANETVQPSIALWGPFCNARRKRANRTLEVKARDGILVAVVTEGDERVASFADHVIEVPKVGELVAPVVASIPLQLLAYHVGVRRGCDVDQPRNLAKSVTVE